MGTKATIFESFDAFADDLLAERSARSLIIVGASKVDDLLLEVLRTFLLPAKKTGRSNDELLEGDRPLATLSSRIKMCRRLGLIDETLYRALEQLRSLRNLCAHEISFDHAAAPARDHLAELGRLVGSRSSYNLTRKRYFDSSNLLQSIEQCQCLLLTVCILLEMIRSKIDRTSGHKIALKISAK